jgi:predicted transcriptional regulator
MIMRRSREEVLDEILEVCKEPKSITRIVYQVNLNFHTVRPHLNGLIDSGQIMEIPGSPIRYKTTPKGLKTLADIKKLKGLLLELVP